MFAIYNPSHLRIFLHNPTSRQSLPALLRLLASNNGSKVNGETLQRQEVTATFCGEHILFRVVHLKCLITTLMQDGFRSAKLQHTNLRRIMPKALQFLHIIQNDHLKTTQILLLGDSERSTLVNPYRHGHLNIQHIRI